MYVLKGFIDHALLVSNAVGVTATIGELSTESLTYSRERGSYVKAGIDDLTLTSFLSARDGTKIAATEVLSDPDTIADHVLTVGKWVYDQTILGANVVNADELLQAAVTQFDAIATNFQCGQIITDGRYYMPEWFSWTHKTLDGGSNQFKVWFVDASFKSQYDEFEFVIIPPLDNLDDFFKTGTEVEALLKARTLSDTMDKIQQAKAGNPETILRADEYDYIDPLNATHIVPSNWGLLIYGAAGNNVDSIKDALINYTLANSTHVKDDWLKILPDIFKRTEFMLVPRWDSYAIPNRTLEAGIYSPVANLTSALALIKQVIVSYPGSHIDTNVDLMGHPYKSLSILAVGGPDNHNDWFKITDVFPDYIDVSSTSLDFNRMSQATRDWMLTLEQMLIIAESMTEYSSIPFSMTRTVRDGILYLVWSYQNIHYLVAAKKNFPLAPAA